MARDWDSFKKEFIEQQVSETLDMLHVAERIIESPIERILYHVIHYEFQHEIASGFILFKRQHQVGKYKADFLFEYPTSARGLKILIECDGHEFHEKTKAQATHDKKRDRYLVSQGYIVMRYTGSEIVKDPWQIKNELWNMIHRSDGVI